jgi:hypothetical protein
MHTDVKGISKANLQTATGCCNTVLKTCYVLTNEKVKEVWTKPEDLYNSD